MKSYLAKILNKFEIMRNKENLKKSKNMKNARGNQRKKIEMFFLPRLVCIQELTKKLNNILS